MSEVSGRGTRKVLHERIQGAGRKKQAESYKVC